MTKPNEAMNPCRSYVQREDYERNVFSTYLWDQGLLQYAWGKSRDINDPGFATAPISTFKHAPLRNILGNMKFEGLLVELPNFRGFREDHKIYWIAKIVKSFGYKVKLHYCKSSKISL